MFCCDVFRPEWGCDVEACANSRHCLHGDRVLIEIDHQARATTAPVAQAGGGGTNN